MDSRPSCYGVTGIACAGDASYVTSEMRKILTLSEVNFVKVILRVDILMSEGQQYDIEFFRAEGPEPIQIYHYLRIR
jgi:hypothetical protein